MKAYITYTQDRRYNKPVRIHVRVIGGDVEYELEVHRRFSQRDASIIARDIGGRYDSFSEDWGTIEVSDTPPRIETIGD